MTHLDGIIKFYLQNETNNSLLITGDWGVGKTYYYKNIIEKEIETFPTYFDNKKKYKSIVVSLFGISSIDEIQSQILLSLYPILGNKKVKISAAIAKIFIKGILKFKNIDQYYDILSEVGIDKKDLINFSGLVICFDDLERMDPDFNIEILIGFINSLTEGNNAKIIIIANSSKLEKATFNKLKEKVIGNTIQFNPDIQSVYNNIIEIKFSGDKIYRDFLKIEKQFFLEVFEANSNNLRTLNFILLYFKQIFYIIELLSSQHKFLEQHKNSVLKKALRFVISISIEYRNGDLSSDNKQDVSDSKNSLTAIAIRKLSLKRAIQNSNNKAQEDKQTYTEIFLGKYYKETEYHFFESIYNFIIGEKIFESDDFLEDLKTIYNIEDEKIPEHYLIFNKLSSSNIFDLSDKEYRLLTKQLLTYTDQGMYKLGDYSTIFYYLVRFNNPLKFKSLENLEKRVIRGMKKGTDHYIFHANLDMYLKVDKNSEFFKNFESIKNACLEINEKLRLKNILLETKVLENLYHTNFELFDNKLTNKDSPWSSSSILNHFNVQKFYNFFINANNLTKWEIVKLIQYRYSSNSFGSFIEEISFLKQLQIRIQKKVKNISKNGLDYFVYTEFNNLLLSLTQ